MQVKNEAQTGLGSEIKVVPRWAWMLVAIGFASSQVFFDIVAGQQPNALPAGGRALLGLLLGTIIGCYLLLIGYVSGDSRRRGMSPLLWTLVAIFVPNALGIVLYFVLRQPLRNACPHCGKAVQTGFNFCPCCSYKLSPNCPECQRPVGVNDVYCPYCGTSLRKQAAPDYAAARP